jgi:hypothetical protein
MCAICELHVLAAQRQGPPNWGCRAATAATFRGSVDAEWCWLRLDSSQGNILVSAFFWYDLFVSMVAVHDMASATVLQMSLQSVISAD